MPYHGFLPPTDTGRFDGPVDSLRVISHIQKQFADSAKRAALVREVKSLLDDYSVEDILRAAAVSMVKSEPAGVSRRDLVLLVAEFNKAAPALEFLKQLPEANINAALATFSRLKPAKVYESLGPGMAKFQETVRSLPVTQVDRLYEFLMQLDLSSLASRVVSAVRSELLPVKKTPAPPVKKSINLQFKL